MNAAIHDNESVKQVIDLKGPLKGKGGMLAHWHAEATGRLAQVHRDMETLAAESKTIAGRRWSLNANALRSSRQLRWRMTSGRHATWGAIKALLANLPPGLARWYTQAEEMAQLLNHRGQAIQYEVKTLERLKNRMLRESRE